MMGIFILFMTCVHVTRCGTKLVIDIVLVKLKIFTFLKGQSRPLMLCTSLMELLITIITGFWNETWSVARVHEYDFDPPEVLL